MNKVHEALHCLIHWAIKKSYTTKASDTLLKEFEAIFKTNLILEKNDRMLIEEAIEILVNFGFETKCFLPNTTYERDAFEALLYDVIMPRKEDLNHFFNNQDIQEEHLIYLYQLSLDVNYIKEKRNQQNISWNLKSKYGILALTINLAKPEKDPKDIKEVKDITMEGRPKCVICKENEGNYWNARKNLRLIPLRLNNETWYFQYSPYAYYPYHCIILHENHIPMKMDRSVVHALVDFVDQFPNFMIGSNAELPIVGGSILNHLHFQGGKHLFPIEEASAIHAIKKDEVTYEALFWPLSTIKIQCKNKNKLINAIMNTYEQWLHYENKEINIISYTDANHQTITPIMRKEKDKYVAYVILRNNKTSIKHPHGIFHPHEELFHIKKENIGLIEAMGLAVLPGRLKKELLLSEKYLNQNTLNDVQVEKHLPWLETLKHKAEVDLYEEVGFKFVKVLEASGVFKQNQQGKQAFEKFFYSIT